MKLKPKATKYKKILLLMIIIIAVIAQTSCTSATPFKPNPAESTAPSIKFLIPGEQKSGGLGMTGDNWFPILVEVSNFQLVDKLGEPNVVGEGHIHYYLDVDPPTDPGKPAVIADGTYVDTPDVSHYWHEIGEGQHIISAQLVNNDHTPLNPPIIAEVAFTVDAFWDG